MSPVEIKILRILKEENFETSIITRQLKITATDGKYHIPYEKMKTLQEL